MGGGVVGIRDKVWLLTGNLLGDPSEQGNADTAVLVFPPSKSTFL